VANLENLFDLREIFKGLKNENTRSSCPIYEIINPGTHENPKNVNLGKVVLSLCNLPKVLEAVTEATSK